jgi:hypothetical protein
MIGHRGVTEALSRHLPEGTDSRCPEHTCRQASAATWTCCWVRAMNITTRLLFEPFALCPRLARNYRWEVLSSVVMNSSILRDIKSCSTLSQPMFRRYVASILSKTELNEKPAQNSGRHSLLLNAGSLLDLLLTSTYRADMFLRNVLWLSMKCMTVYTVRQMLTVT